MCLPEGDRYQGATVVIEPLNRKLKPICMFKFNIKKWGLLFGHCPTELHSAEGPVMDIPEGQQG